MKEKKIGISKITIQMGDKEATLTVEQARELCDALNSLLGEKVVERIIEREQNHWYPYQPYVYPRYWTVTVGDVPTIPSITSGGWSSGTAIVTSPSEFFYGTITLNGDGESLPA